MSKDYDVKSIDTVDIFRDLVEFTESGNDSYTKQLIRELASRVRQ